ncbi:Hypothetical predicted protein [Olea europaea subsp. europaea]|uniref:Uncharacterized protein n=1 Tax=Olea europaea subsp. europaea TaxID=158383 RepID=A0A8S0T9V6_OLEEU|nr:Hypothetical predicted protein [Olea europaea subsp. europaea]
MSCTLSPETTQNYLKIKLHPCRGPNASLTIPAHRDPETNDKYLKIRLRLGQGLHTVPKNFSKMLENWAVTLPWNGCIPDIAYTPLRDYHILDMAYTPCPRNYPQMPRNQAASPNYLEMTENQAASLPR